MRKDKPVPLKDSRRNGKVSAVDTSRDPQPEATRNTPGTGKLQHRSCIQQNLARASRYRDTNTAVVTDDAEPCGRCGTAVKKATTGIGVAVITPDRWTDADPYGAGTIAAT